MEKEENFCFDFQILVFPNGNQAAQEDEFPSADRFLLKRPRGPPRFLAAGVFRSSSTKVF